MKTAVMRKVDETSVSIHIRLYSSGVCRETQTERERGREVERDRGRERQRERESTMNATACLSFAIYFLTLPELSTVLSLQIF